MEYTRRRFCFSASLLWAVASLSPLALAQTPTRPGAAGAPPPSSADLATLGLAAAYDTSGSISRQADLVRSLALIASQRVLVDSGRKSVAEAVDTIRTAIATNRYVFPDVYGAVADLYDPAKVPFSDLLAVGPQAIAAGAFAVAGAAADYFTGGAAEVGGIGLAGLLAMLGSGTASLMSTSQVASRLFPPPSIDDTFALTAWATTELYKAISGPGSAGPIAVSLAASGLIPLNPSRDVSEAKRSLPQSQAAIVDAQGSDKTTAVNTAHEQVANLVQHLDDQTQALLDSSGQDDFVVRDAEIRASRANATYTINELTGAGQLAGVVVGQVFGDPTVGNALKGFTQASATVYAALLNPAMGPLAMAGAVADAASAFLGLGLSSDSQLIQALKPIENRLDSMSHQLDAIRRDDAEILSQLASIYSSLLTSRAQLTSIQTRLTTLTQMQESQDVSSGRYQFDSSRVYLSSARMNSTKGGVDIAGDASRYNDYTTKLEDCFTFGHNVSRYVSKSELPSEPFTSAEWVARIQSKNHASDAIGTLSLVAARLGIPIARRLDVADLAPANPVMWAEGANAFLEAKAYVPGSGGAAAKAQLEALWWDGWQLQQMIRQVVQPRTIAVLRDMLIQRAGFPPKQSGINAETYSYDTPLLAKGMSGAVYEQARSWYQANVLTPKRSEDKRAGHYFIYDQSQYVTTDRYCDFTPDIFQMLLDQQVIAEGPPERSGPPARSLIVKADGPWKDQRLDSEDFSRTESGQIVYPALPQTMNQPPRQPEALQELVFPLGRAYIYRPQASAQLPSLLKTRLSGYIDYDYELCGEMLRVVGLYAQWRAAPASARSPVSRGNCVGPFTIDEVSQYVSEFAGKHLTLTGYWPGEIIRHLQRQISTACNEMISACGAAQVGSSIRVVDETLRKIEGFMLANSWSIPTYSATSA